MLNTADLRETSHNAEVSSSPVPAPLFVTGLLGGAAVAALLVAVAFVSALSAVFAVFVLPVSGAGTGALASRLPVSPAVLALLQMSENM